MRIVTELSQRIKDQGFDHFGFATLKRPFSFDLYQQWLQAGHHADMHYLKQHAPIKENPRLLSPQARSAIVIGQPYFPDLPASPNQPRTALYAQSPDYHVWFVDKLNKLRDSLREVFQDQQFLCYADASPIAERDLAARAGLGWIGKNGCVIDRKRGSLFFLGEIFTSLDFADGDLVPDHCGTCDRCIRACPTNAILPNRTLDSRRCIAYWNIEAKSTPPIELRRSLSDWFFGCDICQTVCPWNEKAFDKERMRALSETSLGNDIESELRWYLTASNREIEGELEGSPLLRARPRGLRRNALMVIANRKLVRLSGAVRHVAETYPDLRELSLWTLAELESIPHSQSH